MESNYGNSEEGQMSDPFSLRGDNMSSSLKRSRSDMEADDMNYDLNFIFDSQSISYDPDCYCLCSAESLIDGQCPCFYALDAQPAVSEFTEEQEAKRKKIMQTVQVDHSQSSTDHPSFLKSVPNSNIPHMESDYGKNRSNTGASCVRYSLIEEKALVHAKLRLIFSANVGIEVENDLLPKYYRYYLAKLAPNDYTRYESRDHSALVRKFKAIKSKHPRLVEFLDRNIEGRFWDIMIELFSHKPLLHPIFYSSNPEAKTEIGDEPTPHRMQ